MKLRMTMVLPNIVRAHTQLSKVTTDSLAATLASSHMYIPLPAAIVLQPVIRIRFSQTKKEDRRRGSDTHTGVNCLTTRGVKGKTYTTRPLKIQSL